MPAEATNQKSDLLASDCYGQVLAAAMRILRKLVDVADWDISLVCSWLGDIDGLLKYEAAFREDEITGEMLNDIDEEIAADVVDEEDVKLLIDEIAKLRAR